MSYSIFYYSIDLILMLIIGDFSICKLAYIWHHVCSIIFLPFLVFNRHQPWFVILVAVLHAILLMLPEFLSLNYFYLASIILCIYGYFQPPFGLQRRYVYLRWITIAASNALIPLWFFTCKNTFNN